LIGFAFFGVMPKPLPPLGNAACCKLEVADSADFSRSFIKLLFIAPI
jgi:hypothetical protein